jgi:hypothetical protein
VDSSSGVKRPLVYHSHPSITPRRLKSELLNYAQEEFYLYITFCLTKDSRISTNGEENSRVLLFRHVFLLKIHNVKVKISLLQAMEAHRVARG